ncbi:long-chain-fatty-acid--CoA ligase [Paenibacillus turpanensis]|uniref:long-chain-fatty-acid--CoA ligase n=1 Tax=Paenibacillus turpanensis TaxID=2689078 RepID=UPI001407D059|nr:long-chain fatty acid--CoA ligase [Paenibacillus turpanensis]
MTFEDKPWLIHYPQEVAPTYNYPKHNAAQLLVQSAHRYPGHCAVYFMGKRLTYAQLLEQSTRFAHALKQLGIQKGERVAIMLPNSPQYLIAFYGTLLMGGIVVQTNPLYMEGELTYQLKDSGAAVIVTLDLLFAKVEKVFPRTELRHALVTSIQDYLPFPKNLLYPIKLRKEGQMPHIRYSSQVHSFKKLLAGAPASRLFEEVDAERDVAVLQYTGGTTGVSKGVMLTHYNLTANTYQNIHWGYKNKDGEERFLAALPCFHVFALTVLMLQSALRAGTLILLPRFEVKQVLEAIHKHKPTIFPGAPTMYIALINHSELSSYDLSSIQVCISGSAPLPLEVQERFEELTGGRLIEGYGLTEASPVTHANPIWGRRKIGSVGVPFPDTEARIVDADSGEDVPVGAIGELLVRGPQVMLGYWNRPDETAKVLRDGWLYTGDMAIMDEDGYFSIVDRKKDMIIASGYNIYPREIEEVLFEHPGIKEAAVAGVPDQYRGETVKAFIVLKEGEYVTEAELDAWCRGMLAAYKVPRLYEFRETLPKTMVGKVLRRKLLEEELGRRESAQASAEDDGRQREASDKEHEA